jgi:hypothetical protein
LCIGVGPIISHMLVQSEICIVDDGVSTGARRLYVSNIGVSERAKHDQGDIAPAESSTMVGRR